MKTKKSKNKAWSSFDNELKSTHDTSCVETSSNITGICLVCSHMLCVNTDGFFVCSNFKCGRICKDVIDQTAEWRYYGHDDNSAVDPTRCGMPINPLLEQSSYGCKVISNGPISYEMLKIKRYTEWQSMPYKEKSQYDEFLRITCMAQHGGIPKLIIDDAVRLHKKISEHQTFRGLNRDGILSASIYVSCRKNNYPRTAKEIANIFKLDATSATKGCKNAIAIINDIEKHLEYDDKLVLCHTSPKDFIRRFCSKLHINIELTKLSEFIAVVVEKKNIIPENTPHSIAAGIIYLVIQVFDIRISKKELHVISGISEVTINKCYKKLDEHKLSLIPGVLLQKYRISL